MIKEDFLNYVATETDVDTTDIAKVLSVLHAEGFLDYGVIKEALEA